MAWVPPSINHRAGLDCEIIVIGALTVGAARAPERSAVDAGRIDSIIGVSRNASEPLLPLCHPIDVAVPRARG